MIGCRRWFVGGTKNEHLPHDRAASDRRLRAAVLVVRDHKGTRIVRCTSYHPSASRKCIHSEPRLRVLLTEGDAKHLALWSGPEYHSLNRVSSGSINYMHIAQKFEGLLEIYRRPDGRKWSGQEIDEATGVVVTRSYITNLRKVRIDNPGYEKMKAIAKAMGFAPEV